MARRMAENYATNSEMKAITQHASDAELSRYTRQAIQTNLEEKAFNILSAAYRSDDQIG